MPTKEVLNRLLAVKGISEVLKRLLLPLTRICYNSAIHSAIRPAIRKDTNGNVQRSRKHT